MGGFLDDTLGIESNSAIGKFLDDAIGIDPHGAFVDDILGINPDPEKAPPAPAVWDEGGVTLNVDRNDAPIPVIYGRRNVGCIRRYIDVSGANTEYLHLVLIWGEGEIDAVENLYLDDIVSTDPKFAGLLQITHHTGSGGQAADANMVAEIPWWTAAHQGLGVAYTAIRLEFKKGVFRGYPKFRADIRGIKCLDPRTGVTAWTQNPVLSAYDYATSQRYGVGLLAADIASPNAEADYCDTPRTINNGGAATHPLYAFNGVIKTTRRTRRNLTDILATCRGDIPQTGGLYTITLDQPGVSEFSFDENNIVGGWSIDFGATRNTINRLTVSYINPDKDWQKDTIVVDEPAFRAQDGTRLLEKKVSLNNTTDYYRARDIATLMMRQSRQGIRASFVAAPAAIKCRIGKLCDITHSTPGWVAKLFRVTRITSLKNGLVKIAVVEYDATVYNLATPNTAPTAPNTTLPDPSHVQFPTGLALTAGDAELIEGYDGTIISRIYAVWTAPADPFVEGYHIEYQVSGAASWLAGAVINDQTSTSTYLSPVEDGKQYDVRVRAVNTMGNVSEWFTRTVVVTGKQAPPPNITSFLVQRQADGTREMAWTLPNPPVDLAGFRIRYEQQGAGNPFAAMTDVHSGLLLASPFETNQIAAGSYTFAIVAVDTSGNESAQPMTYNSTLGNPRISGAIDTIDARIEAWPGTLTNAMIDSGQIIAQDQTTWSGLGATTTDNWLAWINNPFQTITYQHPDRDLGITTTFTPLPTVSGSGTMLTEEQHSSDNVTWTAWATMTGKTVTARYLRVRATVTNTTGIATLDQFQTILGAETIEDDRNDLDTSLLTGVNRIGVGHIKIPLAKPFAAITRVQIALQSLPTATIPGDTWVWWWELVSRADTTNGPEIKIHKTITNAAGQTDTLADALIDAYIKGV